jgi:tetratricopeptide (TPR) repeat protein
MDPSSGRALLIVSAYAQKRQFKDALAEIQNWRRIDNGPWTWAWEAYVYGCAGEAAKAKHALRQVQKAHQGSSADSASMLAVAYLGMNDKDRAIASLQEAYRNHANAPTAFKVDPIYDPLRNDPRFQDLLHRVGLAQ